MSSRPPRASAEPVKLRQPRRVTYRRLLLLARPEWPRLAQAIVFLGLGSLMGLAYPQAIRLLIDGALAAKDIALVDRMAWLMAAVFLVQSVAIGLRFYMFSTIGERVVARLRADVYRHLVEQEIAFFDEHRTGELTSRLNNDATVLQGTVSGNVSVGLRSTAMVIGGVALLFWTSPRLAIVMLAIVPPVAIGAVFFGRKTRGFSKQVQDALAESNEIAEESLAGIRTVRSFAAEEKEATRYRSAVMRSFELARKRIIASGTFMGGASFAAYSAAAVVLWYGGRLVIDGSLTVGGLTSFLVYSLVVAFSFGAIGDVWADFMRAAGAAERIFELLDRASAIPSTGGRTLPAVRGDVAFERVRFAYPSRTTVGVLAGIDLEIKPGENVALVGPSGAGKSTIAALLARLYDPQDGSIKVDGADLRELDPMWLRRQIGTVAQEPILFSTTIAENIRYGKVDATDAEVESAARTANAHEFIAKFPDGYQTKVGERGVQLSGGQKQRVAIARAVLKDPRILILDEATSALDAESEHLVQDALERLMKGRTTLVIAHRLSTVISADRVLVLDGGKLVESGSHHELVAKDGLYKKLVERQFAAFT